ncbi:MAG: polysaccharide pyruvyl transferase family protein [Bacteroidales bacterium]|nr:polysaccharide pyruvyl transferase family protein [Bacteroidales bacterium]
MKVGILTFHRAQNYGAVLQCYALQEILRGLGHDVSVIDYRQPWIEEFYKVFSPSMMRLNSGSLAGLSAFLRNRLKKFVVSPLKASHFRSFRNDFLRLSSSCGKDDIPQDYDVYVIGSDQLWSLHCLGGNLDPVYLGDFRRAGRSKLIGYAVSADMHSVDSSSGMIASHAPLFDALSMREKAVADKVTEISGKHCDVCLDPTLLADVSLWDPVIDDRWKGRDYVLVYEVRWNEETRGLLKKKAEELARHIGKKCEVIDLSSMKYTVSDFVSLFKYAKYVMTTSFHGVVFSLKFGTPFYVMPLWGGYDLRYMELLTSVGAEDRVISSDSAPEPLPMDFSALHERLQHRCEASLAYLAENIVQ